jgi:hypothetical protein
MIRVMTADESTQTEIIVDGKLSGEGVELVETLCNEAIGNGKPVRLYLRDVSIIDESGRALLGRLSTKGISLKAAGLYSSYVVDLVMAERAEALTSRRVPGGSWRDSKRQAE